jgi:membrane protease YdiL (CAAX protease family)
MKLLSFFKSILILGLFLLINVLISFLLQFLLQLNILSHELFKILLSLTFIVPSVIVYWIFKHYIYFNIYFIKNFIFYFIIFFLSLSLQIMGTIIEVWSMSFISDDYKDYYNLLKEMLLPKSNLDAMFSLITIGMIAPICEEFLFRGLILDNLYRKYNFWISNIFQAILFGIAHMNPFQFLYAIPIGLLLGWFYIKTKNLWVPISIHMFTNSIAILSSLIETNNTLIKKFLQFGEEAESIKDLPIEPIYFALFMLAISILLTPHLSKKD